MKQSKNPEDFKVISEILMHESEEITDRVYSQLDTNRIREVVSNLGKNSQGNPVSSSPVCRNAGISGQDLLMSLPVEGREQLVRENLGLR